MIRQKTVKHKYGRRKGEDRHDKQCCVIASFRDVDND